MPDPLAHTTVTRYSTRHSRPKSWPLSPPLQHRFHHPFNICLRNPNNHIRGKVSQGTSMATSKLGSRQASAMVYSDSVAVPAQARCHHFQTAACHLAFLSLGKLVYHHHYYCWHGAFSSARGHPRAHRTPCHACCLQAPPGCCLLSDRMQGPILSTSAQASDHRPLALPG